MNDTVATEDQEQPAGCHQRKARVADRDPGRRTSSGPADICSAPTEAGHMTAADQIVRSAKKVLAMEGRPHMTTQSAANPSRRLETGKIQGIFQKNGSRGRNPRGFIVAKSAICLTNSLLAGTGNSPAPIRENPGSIREAGGAFQRICCEWAFIVVRDKPDP
jgi:hypothetical protein